jgi:ABC-2 type transport system permease protein
MTWTILRVQLLKLWNSRPQLLLTFGVPIVFFSIFALIFGQGLKGSKQERLRVAVVDEDDSRLSRKLVEDFVADESLRVRSEPLMGDGAADGGEPRTTVSLETARAWLRDGEVVVAIHIPAEFSSGATRRNEAEETAEDADAPLRVQLLADLSDQIAPRLVAAVVQRSIARRRIESMAESAKAAAILRRVFGAASTDRTNSDDEAALASVPSDNVEVSGRPESGPFPRPFTGPIVPPWYTPAPTPAPVPLPPPAAGDLGDATGQLSAERREPIQLDLDEAAAAVETVDFFGGRKQAPVVAMYAAGIAVMFLLFSANNAGEALLVEHETGTLERMLTSPLGLNRLLIGKWLWMTLLGVVQTAMMFTWAQLVFHVDVWGRLSGLVVMTAVTSGAAASFALCLATLCRTRAQLQAVSVILILSMSALGGSMVPRYVMSDSLQRLGLITFNAWALDGFNKVFWRDLPVTSLGPQVGVLFGVTIALGGLARLLARRWDCD